MYSISKILSDIESGEQLIEVKTIKENEDGSVETEISIRSDLNELLTDKFGTSNYEDKLLESFSMFLDSLEENNDRSDKINK